MAFATALQTSVEIFGSGPVALVVTFLLATVFYAVTLHLAAVFFIGDVPTQPAVIAAPVPALTSILLQQWGAAVVIPVTLLGDFVAIRFAYDLEMRAATALTLLHFAFATVIGVALANVLGVT
ncbi:MAG: hypothetical protein V5A24_09175 [Haloarculaceae archaeon]